MSVLETEVSGLIFQGDAKAIKIIHGHGTGALKNAVREWCKDQQGRFKAIIFGENYDMFDKESMDMRSDCELPDDKDFCRRNSAITYIWLR
ncbi:MAG: hypothetical protein CMG37_06420 [Candidatus Marinimicrobia bacterium]|nr:hypothetical protein [Candidatus Neomarinimicrobiota bacterium]